MRRRGDPGLVGVLFCLIGAVSLVVAGSSAWGLQRARAQQVHTVGIVVAQNKRCRRGCSYSPIVEYEVLGRKYQVTGTVGNASPLFEIGEEVAVLYPERAPEQARIDALSETGFPIAFGLGFFVLFGGLGTTFVLMARRGRADARTPDANR